MYSLDQLSRYEPNFCRLPHRSRTASILIRWPPQSYGLAPTLPNLTCLCDTLGSARRLVTGADILPYTMAVNIADLLVLTGVPSAERVRGDAGAEWTSPQRTNRTYLSRVGAGWLYLPIDAYAGAARIGKVWRC
jgi:hypothetical protein